MSNVDSGPQDDERVREIAERTEKAWADYDGGRGESRYSLSQHLGDIDDLLSRLKEVEAERELQTRNLLDANFKMIKQLDQLTNQVAQLSRCDNCDGPAQGTLAVVCYACIEKMQERHKEQVAQLTEQVETVRRETWNAAIAIANEPHAKESGMSIMKTRAQIVAALEAAAKGKEGAWVNVSSGPSST